MSYEYSYVMEDALGTGLITGLISSIPSFALSAAIYVLSALALYTIAKRRGINKPWLAWIPVVNVWLIGSISDQYRYVVKGEIRSKRKTLLILNILNMVMYVLMFVFLILMIVGLVRSEMYNYSEDAALMEIMRSAIGTVCVSVIVMGISIATMIVRYIAMYDIYVSMDPSNSVLYLVMSILFSVTEPFFLFFNRDKDLGMPPRKEAPVYMPPVEHWQQNNENEYL